MSRHEPFGYRKTSEGLVEIPDEKAALERAKFYIETGCSMYVVRDWLVNKTGRQISVPGLLKIIEYDGRKAKKTDQNEDSETNS